MVKERREKVETQHGSYGLLYTFLSASHDTPVWKSLSYWFIQGLSRAVLCGWWWLYKASPLGGARKLDPFSLSSKMTLSLWLYWTLSPVLRGSSLWTKLATERFHSDISKCRRITGPRKCPRISSHIHPSIHKYRLPPLHPRVLHHGYSSSISSVTYLSMQTIKKPSASSPRVGGRRRITKNCFGP